MRLMAALSIAASAAAPTSALPPPPPPLAAAVPLPAPPAAAGGGDALTASASSDSVVSPSSTLQAAVRADHAQSGAYRSQSGRSFVAHVVTQSPSGHVLAAAASTGASGGGRGTQRQSGAAIAHESALRASWQGWRLEGGTSFSSSLVVLHSPHTLVSRWLILNASALSAAHSSALRCSKTSASWQAPGSVSPGSAVTSSILRRRVGSGRLV
ncbi:MAG: hypothetical protein J3K34DRAFT_398540 [Monoraphidium minutum]|nr:MAG: hypothetical protein J3K34DRAFT_398540 [Monoraphidium minutum]